MTEEIKDDAPVSLAAEFSAEEAPKRRAPKAEKPVTAKYTVIGGAIAPFGGGRADLIHPGNVVELTAEQAKHYNKLGYLKPHIEE